MPDHSHSGSGHTHDHSHDHSHSGHSQSHGAHSHSHSGHVHPPLKPSVLAWAMVATLGLVVAEVFGGFLGRSVALLNNAVLLVLLSAWLGYEAIERLRAPVQVVESWMIWTSLAALAVNGGITLAVMRGHKDLNLRTILIHNFGDAISNIAIIAGAIAIHYTGRAWIDPILGLAIGLLVLWSSIGILRASAHILLEGRPQNLQVEEVARAILTVPGVHEVHDVHIWSLGGDHNALSCHARIPDMHMDECESVLTAIRQKLHDSFAINHVTIQLERAGLPAQSGYVMPEPAQK